MKLTIIVPVYNEAFLLTSFWSRLKSAPIDRCNQIDSVEIIVVDDGSTDGTTGILRKLCSENFEFTCGISADTRFEYYPKNRGKGAAVRFGITQSTGEVIIIQDSDLEYSPTDYPSLISPITDNDADVVYGSRFIGSPRRVLYFWHALFNKFITTCSNIMCDQNLTDMSTCYKAIRGDLARSLRLVSSRFGIEAELTARIARSRARVFEVPVSYRGRTYDEGKKIGKSDALAMLFHIFRFNLLDREPFQPGLYQSLTALDEISGVVYEPLLRRALAPFLKTGAQLKILEIGSGIGSLTKMLARFGTVTATDISRDYVRTLKDRFADFKHVSSLVWDATLTAPADIGTFDLIVSFNVLEHIDNDTQALINWQSLLNPGGGIIILVPNNPRIYTPIDKALGHFRRYTSKGLQAKLASSGLELAESFYGNAIGILGWVVTGLILRKKELPASQLKSYVLVKRLFSRLERAIETFTGLSIIVVARKKNPSNP